MLLPRTRPRGEAALKFKELAEKYTQGTAKAEVYPNAEIHEDVDEMDVLQRGESILARAHGRWQRSASTCATRSTGKRFRSWSLPSTWPV
ncbi:MAG: hypothetical protein LBB76_05225 [Azoarcus sp.]|jgi:TRAP-type C4-dicarboxylate transport system substrate-binding protein|nr:hypothetical protein [Azoarcus sp.]